MTLYLMFAMKLVLENDPGPIYLNRLETKKDHNALQLGCRRIWIDGILGMGGG